MGSGEGCSRNHIVSKPNASEHKRPSRQLSALSPRDLGDFRRKNLRPASHTSRYKIPDPHRVCPKNDTGLPVPNVNAVIWEINLPVPREHSEGPGASVLCEIAHRAGRRSG